MAAWEQVWSSNDDCDLKIICFNLFLLSLDIETLILLVKLEWINTLNNM